MPVMAIKPQLQLDNSWRRHHVLMIFASSRCSIESHPILVFVDIDPSLRSSA